MVDILSFGLMLLLHANPAFRLFTAGRLTARGLLLRYPIAVAGLSVSACLQVAMLCGWWTGGMAGYARAWQTLTPWQIALSIAVATDCLWKLCQHFPLPRNLMALMVGAFGVVCVVAALPLSAALASVVPMAAVRRHCMIVLAVILGLSRLALIDAEPAMRENAKRYSAAVLLGIGSTIAADVLFGMSKSYWVVAVGQLLLTACPLIACRWWWAMDAAGERWERTPGPSLEDLDADWDRITAAIKARRAGAGE